MKRKLRIPSAMLGGLVAACSTTTDPYACAEQGVFSVSCQGHVQGETERLRAVDYSAELAALDSTNLKVQQAKEREAGLEQQAAALRDRLKAADLELSGFKRDLDDRLRQNRLTKANYDRLTVELAAVQTKIGELRNQAYTTKADLAKADVYLSTEVAQAKRRVKEIQLLG